MSWPKTILGFVILGSFILPWMGCQTAPKHHEAPSGIVGSWTYKDSFQGSRIMTFRKDGNYVIDYDGKGTQDAWGKYELNWDKITLTDQGGRISDDCRGSGNYTYTLSGNELHYRFVADDCAQRRHSFEKIWQRM